MATEKLKTFFAKRRHGEFMVNIASLLIIAIFNSLLASDTLKLFTSPEHSTETTFRIVVWCIVELFAIYMMIEGLRRIDIESATKTEPTDISQITAAHNTSSQDRTLNIQINHGNTQISISIKQDQGDSK